MLITINLHIFPSSVKATINLTKKTFDILYFIFPCGCTQYKAAASGLCRNCMNL